MRNTSYGTTFRTTSITLPATGKVDLIESLLSLEGLEGPDTAELTAEVSGGIAIVRGGIQLTTSVVKEADVYAPLGTDDVVDLTGVLEAIQVDLPDGCRLDLVIADGAAQVSIEES